MLAKFSWELLPVSGSSKDELSLGIPVASATVRDFFPGLCQGLTSSSCFPSRRWKCWQNVRLRFGECFTSPDRNTQELTETGFQLPVSNFPSIQGKCWPNFRRPF